MRSPVLHEEVKNMVKNRKFADLREKCIHWPPADLAELLDSLQDKEKTVAFRLLPKAIAADAFEKLPPDSQARLIRALGNEEAAAILDEMSDTERTALLEEAPEQAVRLLGMLSEREARCALHILGYPEDSVGRLMTTHFFTIREDWTVKETLDYVRTNGNDSETLNVLYVVDDNGVMIDDVRIREFLLRPVDARVKDFRDHHFIALKVTDSERDAVAVFRKYDRTVLPVLDANGVIVGIVTVDDILDVQANADTSDVQKIGGMEVLGEPYLKITLLKMVQKRAGWLVILFLGEMLTATALGYYEDELSRAVILALFLPLIISSGGNSGSQASTLVIRAMALGEVRLRDWFRVLFREIQSGAMLGVILGSIGFLRISLWHVFTPMYGAHWFLIAMTIWLALIGVVLWGSLMGAMLPFVLKRCGCDPAASSAPFVATLVDVTGLMIYFNIAMIILKGTLL